MEEGKFHLLVVSPEKTLFDGPVDYVRLPGSMGQFAVLHDHAPLISSLDAGEVFYRIGEEKVSLNVAGGFVEVNDNNVSVCVTEAAS